MLGATFLLSGADRLPPRAILSGLALAFAAGTAVLALPGLPVRAVFAVVLLQGLVASLGGGVRGGLLNEILPKDGYVLGRSVFNMLWGLVQMAGFATGGALLALLSPRTCLLLAAALYVMSALVTRLGLTARPPRFLGRPSLSATWRANALLWSSRPRRLTYLGLWVPNGLVVGSDSLYVSYAPKPPARCTRAGRWACSWATWRWVAWYHPRCALVSRPRCACCWRLPICSSSYGREWRCRPWPPRSPPSASPRAWSSRNA
ncbi:hypothetical protein SAV14893_087010 [Streptomyces avermitilis]|uniref:Major facilitator superfamily (MFS) profile domain-containing protein n=1 Tax=Streptomyces avermitilis TaxID=33903 RepID=A0A4D4MBM9_STRAX|nr:hypothetical protein SAV14893_087010 [Streptomyces avermitilis]